MVCKTCGAALEDNTIICPYCGWENEPLAAMAREAEVSELRKKNREYKRKPEKAAKTASVVLICILAGLLILFGMSVVVTAFINRSDAFSEVRDQQKALSDLEKFYDAGDYAGMNEYLRYFPDSSASPYKKYYKIGQLYERICNFEEDYPHTVGFAADKPGDTSSLESDLERLFYFLGECKALEDAGYVYGEEKAVSDFSARAKTILKDVFLLNDEEIQSGIESSQSEEPNYAELSDISMKRLNGENG